MPANGSYDVFLLERGTELSLISQTFIQPQPTLTVTHDTQLFLTYSLIRKSADKICQKITASERMKCVIEKIQSKILTTGITCLPFQFNDVFPILYQKYPQCKNDSALATTILSVGYCIILKFIKIMSVFSGNMANY